MKNLTLAGLLAFAALPSFAQKSSAIPEFVFTENKHKTAGISSLRIVQIIDSAAIRMSPAQTVAELLENTAGVDIRSRGPFGTQADVQIRGGSFEQTLILLNGVRMTDPQTGHHLLNLPVSTFDIERIEILKGAAARVYGMNAYAGVINIITRKPVGKNLSFQVAGGQYGFRQLLGSSDFKLGKTQHRFSIQNLSSDGYRSNTDFDNSQLLYQNELQVLQGSMETMAGLQAKKTGSNGYYTDRFPKQYEETKLGFASLNYQHKNGKLKSKLLFRAHGDEFLLKRDTPSFSRNTHTSQTLNFDISYGSENKLGHWNTGLEFRQELLTSNSLGNRSRSITGFFADQHIQLGEKFKVIPGICLNNYSDFGLSSYPSLDLGYTGEALSMSAQVSRGFRVPSFTELYYSDAGKTSIGNPDLQAEQAWNYELNLFYRKNWLVLQAGVFLRDGKKQIDWIRDSATAISWVARNQSESKTSGYEWNLTIKPSFFREETKIQNIQLAYCRVDLNQTNPSGISRYVYDYLQNQFTATVQVKMNKSLDAFVRARNESRVGYAQYWLCDLKVQYQRNRFSLFAEASNLFDASYREVGNVIMPGRWVRTGLSYRFDYK